MNKIPLETIDGDLLIRFRDCFSVRYIQSAALLCRLGYAIEREYEGMPGEISPEILLRHEAFILSSILSSVAFLESTINELYSDAADNAYFFAEEKNEALLQKIADGWKNEKNFDRAPMLTKYQKILVIAEKPPFDESGQVFSDVHNLILIRNFLMHYRREWVVIETDGAQEVPGAGEETRGEKFGKILKNRFQTNPLAPEGLPFFPEKCLGHGCAEWAVVTSLAFTDEFYRKLGLPAPYDGVKKELGTR